MSGQEVDIKLRVKQKDSDVSGKFARIQILNCMNNQLYKISLYICTCFVDSLDNLALQF